MPVRALIACLLLLVFAVAHAASDSSRIAERYKQMIEKNPVEGTVLDRLWKLSQENSATGALLDEYKAASGTFTGAMIYGHLLQKAGRMADARTAYEHAATLDPNSALPRLSLARLFSAQQEPKEAAGELEKVVALLRADDPSLTDTLLKLGDAWLAANELAKAAEAWEQIVARDPGNFALRQRLAENYEKNGLPEKAIAQYQYLESHGEAAQQAQALLNLARIHQSRGEEDTAIQSLEKALGLVGPGNWMRGELQARLIRLHQRFNRTGELEDRWKKAVEQNPRDLAGYLQLVDLYERIPNLDQQKVWLEKLCELAPKNAEYKIKLARLLVQLGQTDRAADMFDRVLKEQPSNADLVFARAEIDLQRDAPQAAKARIEALIEALIEASKNDEMVRSRSLDFFVKYRFFDAVEQQLVANAISDEGVLALARFCFAQHKPADARSTLQRLVKKTDPAEKQAAAFMKIAQMLKEQSDLAGALAAMQQAVELQPRSAESLLALADSLLALNRFEEAQKAAEQAWDMSTDEAARIAADQKLLRVLQARAANEEAASKTTPWDLRRRIELPPGPRLRTPPVESELLNNYISMLAKKAADNPSSDAFLRLARWHSWNRNYKAALGNCQRALELDPKFIPALEFAVKMESAGGQKNEAIAHLRKLAEIDPARRQSCLMETGRLSMEAGQPDDALRIYSDLEKENPGDIETLSGLAVAQQQTGKWEDALATWQRAYEASPAVKKRELTQPLLNALERTGRHPQAARLLLTATDGQPDENARLNSFQDLLNYCKRHEMTPWLQEQYEQRHKLRPDDYFAAVAFARILKANGKDSEALAVLGEAVYSAPNEAGALKELVREEEQAGDFDAAIRHQQRLLLLVPQSDSAELEKLAALQEDSFDLDGAERTWEKIARLFPRDPSAQNRAAEFFMRWGAPEKATEVLRRLRVLDPENARALLLLAKLAEDTGNGAEAISCCEQILQHAPPAKSDAPLVMPHAHKALGGVSSLAPGRVPVVGSIMAGTPQPAETDLCLKAIRVISQNLRSGGDRAALRTWLARWENAQAPCEALWAFYFAGANDLAMKQLGAMIEKSPDAPQVQQGFISLALDMREYARLRDWILDQSRPAATRAMLTIELDQWLNGNPQTDSRLLSELFNEPFAYRDILWESAVLFAKYDHYEEALRLGHRVLDSCRTQRASYATRIAEWHIVLGDRLAARQTLQGVLNETGSSLDDPVFSALRTYFLLLGESERAPFVESVARRENAPALHSALALSLLYGLQGNEEAAQAGLKRLLEMRPIATDSEGNAEEPAANRYWNFVLTTGSKLELWKFDRLARFWWGESLADPAAIKLQGEQAVRLSREVMLRFCENKLAGADAVEMELLLDEFERIMTPEMMQALASALERSQLTVQSLRITQRLWQRDPANPHRFRALMNACRIVRDKTIPIAALRQIVSGGLLTGDPASNRECVALLVDLLLESGEWTKAKAILQATLTASPGETPFLARMARVHEQLDEWDQAAAMYRLLVNGDPANPEHQLSLALALESAGKRDAAIELLQNAKCPRTRKIECTLLDFYRRAKRPDKVQETAARLFRSGDAYAIGYLAEQFAAFGPREEALKLMPAAIAKCDNPGTRFEWQCKLLEIIPADDQKRSSVETRRLRTFAEELPGLLERYFDMQIRLAKKTNGDVQKELAAMWDGGAGSPVAGAKLIEWYIETRQEDKMRAVFAEFVASPQLTTDSCKQLQSLLDTPKHRDLALELSQTFCRKWPGPGDQQIERARLLAALGRRSEADAILETLSLSGELPRAIAGMYIDIGDIPAARRTYAMAMRMEPNVEDYSTYLNCARLLLSEKDWRRAKRVLIAAFRNPLNDEVNAIVDAYVDAKKLDQIEAEVGEFKLSPERSKQLHLAIFDYYDAHDDARAALAFAGRHPDLVASEADVRLSLISRPGNSGDFHSVEALFQKVLAQADPSDPSIALDLAVLYKDRAGTEIAAGQSDAALDHLQRASKLDAANFEIARKLGELYVQRNQPERAAEVLKTFIRATQNEAEREKAQRSLDKMSAGN